MHDRHPQPLSSSQLQPHTQETSASPTQSSSFSEFDLSRSLPVLLHIILFPQPCPKDSALGIGNLLPSKRHEPDKPAQAYLVGDSDAGRSSDSTAPGKYQHCWHDRRKTGWLYGLVSSHQILSWNIFHCTPVVSQKRSHRLWLVSHRFTSTDPFPWGVLISIFNPSLNLSSTRYSDYEGLYLMLKIWVWQF